MMQGLPPFGDGSTCFSPYGPLHRIDRPKTALLGQGWERFISLITEQFLQCLQAVFIDKTTEILVIRLIDDGRDVGSVGTNGQSDVLDGQMSVLVYFSPFQTKRRYG